jgi:hypothetical protein
MEAPWRKYASKIRYIVIEDGITAIGVAAFMGIELVTEVIIPDSVTSFGGGDFAGCTSLKRVVLSNNLVTIASGTFAYCSALTELFVPKSVVNIGVEAFFGCSQNLTVYFEETSLPSGRHFYWDAVDGIDIGANQTSEKTKDASDFCITILRRAHGLKEP